MFIAFFALMALTAAAQNIYNIKVNVNGSGQYVASLQDAIDNCNIPLDEITIIEISEVSVTTEDLNYLKQNSTDAIHYCPVKIE